MPENGPNAQAELRRLMISPRAAVSPSLSLDCFFSHCNVNSLKNGRVSPDQRGQCNNLFYQKPVTLWQRRLEYLLTISNQAPILRSM